MKARSRQQNPAAWVWVAGAAALAGAGALAYYTLKPKRAIIKPADLKTIKLTTQRAAPLKMTQQQMDLQKKVGAALFKPSTSVPK